MIGWQKEWGKINKKGMKLPDQADFRIRVDRLSALILSDADDGSTCGAAKDGDGRWRG